MCGNEDELRLVSPCVELQNQYIEMAEEFVRHDVGTAYQQCLEEALADFARFVRRLHERDFGMNLPTGCMQSTTYWLMKGKQLVGTSCLRHRLDESLMIEGGHIGYSIRPSERGKGYGRRQLALLLDKARQRFLSRVLLTCDAGNTASAKIIMANGGVFSGEVASVDGKRQLKRFWIDLWPLEGETSAEAAAEANEDVLEPSLLR